MGHKRGGPKGGFQDHPEHINRKGRPKLGMAIAERIRAALEAQTKAEGDQIIDTLVAEAIKRAKRGHFQFWDALIARAYGKVPEKIELNQDEKPDLSKLTNDEIQALTALLEKAKPG